MFNRPHVEGATEAAVISVFVGKWKEALNTVYMKSVIYKYVVNRN